MAKQGCFNGDVCCVVEQPSEIHFYSPRSLQQNSTGTHVAPLRYITSTPSQLVLLL